MLKVLQEQAVTFVYDHFAKLLVFEVGSCCQQKRLRVQQNFSDVDRQHAGRVATCSGSQAGNSLSMCYVSSCAT